MIQVFLFLALVAISFNQLNGQSKSGRGHHEGQFCKNILNVDQWFRRKCRLKIFLTRALVSGAFFRRSETNCGKML